MYINLFKSKLNSKDSEDSKYSIDEMKYINCEADYSLIIHTLASRKIKPSIFTHIYLLLTQKLKSNSKNVQFYFLQILLPTFITIITCYIVNSLTNDTRHLNISNIKDFSKFYKFYMPVFYNKLKNDSVNKDILNLILEDYIDGNYIYDYLENKKTDYDSCCHSNQTNVCAVNNLPQEVIKNCDDKFPILKHRSEDISLHLIKECESKQYLTLSRFNHIYTQ